MEKNHRFGGRQILIHRLAFRPDPHYKYSMLATPDSSSLPALGYRCQRCTNCCRWPGFVALSNSEIPEIARFLKMNEWDFIQRYTQLRPNRQGLALIDQGNGACVFLEGKDCAIQSVKPSHCKGFPNTWNFPGWRDVCEAIPLRPCVDDHSVSA